MGLRFRKSVNLGGGFRINFSKSGVGYSFGGKGFRYTKTARGTSPAARPADHAPAQIPSPATASASCPGFSAYPAWYTRR